MARGESLARPARGEIRGGALSCYNRSDMRKPTIKTIGFHYQPDNKSANLWQKKISAWLSSHYPKTKVVGNNPDLLIALGGDGTILEAARKSYKNKTIILGMNLGEVGFTASVREPKNFLKALNLFLAGQGRVIERIMLSATVKRGGKQIAKTLSLNDLAIQNLLGVVPLEVSVEGYGLQNIKGTGLLISTPTGSTAYNLSAHGPIVAPELDCVILTELLDHNMPTPSIVIKPSELITVNVKDFRQYGKLKMEGTDQKVDVVLVGDGEIVLALAPGDAIEVCRAKEKVKFVELEPHYFFKSLHEKFMFK